ncbi:unnamed protein product [Psylliodes chrysocephalus]|uniref:TOG domain-containing protein n=1 Tax=Psylliodes chrysocephalus TaxID=3402493 RepID=A0A9P0CZD2_9CUCU|nr:unnamed protein product [Psylliodes chrysocephala]
MQNIKPCPTKKSKFSNFVYQPNENSSNDYRTGPFVECFRANICKQTELGSTPSINLSNSKKIEYLRECYTQTNRNIFPDQISPARYSFSNIGGQRNFLQQLARDRMMQNHCEGDTKADYEPLMTQEELASLPFDRTFNVVNFLNQEDCNQNHYYEPNLNFQSTLTYKSVLRKKSQQTETIDYGKDRGIEAELTQNNSKASQYKVTENTQTELKAKSFSFMSPTIASECKNQSLDIKHIESLIAPTRKVRSMSPKRSASPKAGNRISRQNASSISRHNERSDSALLGPENIENDAKLDISHSCAGLGSRGTSATSTENALLQAVNKLRDSDWNVALRGLAEIVEISRLVGHEHILQHMTVINQKLIDLIKSPRSHVSRTSCQAAGHIFEFVKDTRRPEFDELVDSLLCKCADSNRFIRHDANLALDCMVTHIPTFHAVRAICSKGPEHKNPLVRVAAARLLVCSMVLSGPQNIIHPSSNEYTKRRIIMKMAGFLEDRSPDVRKYGERIYKMLSKDKIFDVYLNRFLEKDVIIKMKKIMKNTTEVV